jgi:lipopolysaccharide transport system ATP-binding protein
MPRFGSGVWKKSSPTSFSMKSIISVRNISKQYRIGQREAYGSLRETLTSAFSAPFRRFSGNGLGTAETIWALRDVGFEVATGEAVGIIGRNGAGKSTLLKILSRITEPTTGIVDLYGRVGSLLEVGTGFHPELTGRENIFLNGAILGMQRVEIERKFDEIVSFAEIERFLDTPVKRYSSGMYMRLAFAVAAHLEPEILLVDEVLAVGDAQFQKKCLGKMGEVAREGRTVLFVSHNMMAVQSLCPRAIWFEDGRILQDGESGQVVADYLQHSFSALAEQVWEDIATAPGNDKVRLRSARVRLDGGSTMNRITVHSTIDLEFEYWNLVPDTCLNLSLLLHNQEGVTVLNTGPTSEPVWHGRPFPAGLFRSVCRIPGNFLNDTPYRVTLYVIKDQSSAVFVQENILMFEVCDTTETRSGWYGKWPGVVRPNFDWTTEMVEDSQAIREIN